MSVGASYKTFTTTEVSNNTAITKEVTVDAKSPTWFYQKEYEFITEKLYIVEDGNGDCVVYIRGKPTAQYSTQTVRADEYTTRKSEITGTGVVHPVTVARAPITKIYDVDALDRHSRVTFNNFWNTNPNRTPPA
ncbi:hypothetical protein BDZ89DRAFT_1073974 [Hymenopellis radicata]|nr:hypothetical protein BDZ89DRAFT_1073974 [Hymenopellis radicata]